MNANDSSLVGTLAADYHVLSRIGSGSMGHVYEAEKLGNRVALKVLHKHHQEQFAARFLREGKTLRLLSHPNIVELVDMGQLENGSLYLATELISGKSLREVMKGPIEERRALAITRQILEALDAAHALGVVHRDIKPENIMIGPGEQGVVKVLDFGVAKLLTDTIAGLGEANLTSVGFSIFGSALYIAPESVTGQPVDARLDLYSVGAMLYEMLTGRPVYDHEDPSEILRQHAFGAIPSLQQGAPNRTFSPALEQLVAQSLAKKPDDRFPSAAHMIAALDAVATPVVAERPAPLTFAQSSSPPPQASASRELSHTYPVRIRVRRHRLVLAGAAAVLLTVAIVLVLRGGDERKKPPERSELATRAQALLAAGDYKQAIEMIEKDLVTADGTALLVLGHARLAAGRRVEALGAYERALRVTPQLAADDTLRAKLKTVVEVKESLAVVVALELLASLSPPAHESIISYASTGKDIEGRHRAVMLAERDGVAGKIDRVESWSLDLQQSASCDDRKAVIAKLAAASDRRALAPLKKARATKCIEREAADAIARIESAP